MLFFFQSLFYEVLSGIWVRNGLQIKGQAMTYIQANFCNSMVDMDLFFLQICATQLPAKFFLSSCIDSFSVNDWFFSNLSSTQDMENDSMMEGMLTFLATLITSRTNLGNDEDMKCIVEISALLATSDKTHSQLLDLMPERSGNAYARNFEKYLKQLSTYRPPPVGSENLEQGLFIPLPEVWRIHFDPLHVLLRAVHRRDFQNSMDRFSAFVRQQKRMPKSGNLWPPFRIPCEVGNLYSDPACVLNTKIFHSMILGILYRAVHVKNISENLMALAIFLLEIAVTKSKKDSWSTTVECSSMNLSSKSESSVPPELMNSYPSNNLFENLCLQIDEVTIRSAETQNSPANYQSRYDSDLEFELSEADQMPMLVGSAEEEFAVMRSSTEGRNQERSVVRETSLISMDVDQSSTEPRSNLLPLTYENLTPSNSTQVSSPNNSNMQVARREIQNEEVSRQIQHILNSSERETMGDSSLVLFNRFQPIDPLPSQQNMDLVPADSTNSSRRRRKNEKTSVDNSNVLINDSILSLLLKLHSQLSGTLDSFSLEDHEDDDDDTMDDESSTSSQTLDSIESRIGDGPYFIGNLLRKIAKADKKCAKTIDTIRQTLWPNQRERQAEQKAKEAKEKEERTKKARERQKKIMEEFANRQKQFMATEGKIMDSIEDDDNDIEEAREKEYNCIICSSSGPSTESNPIGLVVLVEPSSIVGHRRKTPNRFPLPICDEDKEIPGRNERLSSEFRKKAEILNRKYGPQWFLTQNICWEGGVHVQSCGHHVHLSCHESYLKSLRRQNLNIELGEFSCPICRQLANSVLPLSPQLDKPASIVRNQTDYAQLCQELKDLIRDCKRTSVRFLLTLYNLDYN